MAGSTLRLVCTVAGARPAATLRWYNATPATAPRALASSTQLASLQGDGTYVSLSRLEVELGAWHHGHTLYCLADTDTGSQAHTTTATAYKYFVCLLLSPMCKSVVFRPSWAL